MWSLHPSQEGVAKDARILKHPSILCMIPRLKLIRVAATNHVDQLLLHRCVHFHVALDPIPTVILPSPEAELLSPWNWLAYAKLLIGQDSNHVICQKRLLFSVFRASQ